MGILSILAAVLGLGSFLLFGYGKTNIWLGQHNLLGIINWNFALIMCAIAIITGLIAKKNGNRLGTAGIKVGAIAFIIIFVALIISFIWIILGFAFEG